MAAAQGGICTYCKKPFPEDLADTAVDHIIPRCRGGPNADFHAGGSAQGSGVVEAESASAPPGHGGVCGEAGLAQDG